MIDFPLSLRDENERWTWLKGSLWLSLDQFERFWPDVGLTLENGEAVKSAVRDALRVQYAINAANRARWAADPNSPDELDETAPVEELAKTCFRTLTETAGTEDTERVAAWLTGPVLAANKEAPWHCTWSILLFRMGEEDPRTLMSHGISGDTARKLIEIAARFRSEVDTIEDRIEAAEQEPLSDWDAIAYADYQWDSAGVYPLSGLRSLFKYLAFDRAWAEVLRCTRPADINSLIQWGRANLGPNSDLYEHATIPDDVRSAWRR
ncbi:MAG: hypothetical protein IPM54_22910 [Polyangiaceae bacterium]|nr:hypothetical protein [Polyangiaceae bacterium]